MRSSCRSAASPRARFWAPHARKVSTRAVVKFVVADAPAGLIKVVGSVPEAGQWSPSAAPSLNNQPGTDTCERDIDISSPSMEFKLVLVQDGNGAVRWEGGANRVLALADGQDWKVVCRFDDPGSMQVAPLPRAPPAESNGHSSGSGNGNGSHAVAAAAAAPEEAPAAEAVEAPVHVAAASSEPQHQPAPVAPVMAAPSPELPHTAAVAASATPDHAAPVKEDMVAAAASHHHDPDPDEVEVAAPAPAVELPAGVEVVWRTANGGTLTVMAYAD